MYSTRAKNACQGQSTAQSSLGRTAHRPPETVAATACRKAREATAPSARGNQSVTDDNIPAVDASIIKPKFGQLPAVVGAVFDYNVHGVVSRADFSQVKPLFRNSAPQSP